MSRRTCSLQCLQLVHCRLPGLCLLLTRMCSILRNLTKNHDDVNSPGDVLPSKRARTASSSSYAEFISGTASRNAIASKSLTIAGPQKMFGRDAIGNGYDIIREHTALILPDEVAILGQDLRGESASQYDCSCPSFYGQWISHFFPDLASYCFGGVRCDRRLL